MIKASYGSAATDRCPFFYFSDMVLAETTCDGKKKMYELMGELKHCHIMQLPPGSRRKRRAGVLEGGSGKCKRRSGRFLWDQDYRRKTSCGNPFKKPGKKSKFFDFYEVGRLKPTPISGYELNTVVTSNDYAFDIEEKIKYLEQRTRELTDLYEKEYKGKKSRPRILITGCPTHGVIDKVIRRIEELGADVVGFENCCGPREKKDPIDEEKDPITAIAEKYLRGKLFCDES